MFNKTNKHLETVTENQRIISKLEYQFRKVQGIMGEHSFSIVLPKLYAVNLGISKGDFVKVSQESDKIIIEKA